MKPKEIFEEIKKEGRNNLTEFEARKVLEYYKIPVVEAKLVREISEAVDFARKIGYPIVLKVSSPQIVHKTEAGAVILGIENEKELKKAYVQLIKNVKKYDHKAKVQGVLVEKMIDGCEVIVGGEKDPQFGQTIMFGLGGVFVEAFEDVSFRVVPIDRKDAEEMIGEIKGYRILKGYRGKSYDIKALIDILLKTSKLLEENQEIKELDINPVMALSKGALAVDARIVLEG